MRTVILGAGVTGLAAGIKTGGNVYEAKSIPGGICRSYRKKGYHFDIGGGHWIFKADPILDFLKEHSAVKPYTRRVGTYINTMIPGLIQELKNKTCYKTGTLKYWMEEKFGSELGNLFFHPWHEKYTGGLYDQIVQDDVTKSPQPKGDIYNKYFYYPINGLSELVDSMAKKCDVKYNKNVVAIDTKNKKVVFQDSSYVKYDKLISTIPLIDLLEMVNITHKLPFTSCDVLNIGAVRGTNCPNEHWVYVPYCKSGFYRVGFYSNVDHKFAHPDKVSIYVEKTKTNDVPLKIYKDNVIKELQEWGWIRSVDIIDHNPIRVAYTWLYPDSNREKLLTEVNKLGITSIGRYGSWRFCGISESIQQGLSC